MFDFGSLAKNSSAEVPATLSELFKQLDRKTTHTSLRPAQLAALAALDDQLTQRDVIMKLSTGSGKTVLGLVYAEMMRRKYKGDGKSPRVRSVSTIADLPEKQRNSARRRKQYLDRLEAAGCMSFTPSPTLRFFTRMVATEMGDQSPPSAISIYRWHRRRLRGRRGAAALANRVAAQGGNPFEKEFCRRRLNQPGEPFGSIPVAKTKRSRR